MRLCCKMNDGIRIDFSKQTVNKSGIGYIAFNKLIVGFVFNIFKIGKVTCIGQAVEVTDVVIGIVVYKPAHNMRTYESGTTCNNNCTFWHEGKIKKLKLNKELFAQIKSVLPARCNSQFQAVRIISFKLRSEFHPRTVLARVVSA